MEPRDIRKHDDLKVIKYDEGKYLDKLIEFNKRKKDFSNYLLLTLNDEILAQISVSELKSKKEKFGRLLDLKILDNFKVDCAIDEFIQHAINTIKEKSHNKIYTFVVEREKEMVTIYKRNGFSLSDHVINETRLGSVLERKINS